MNHIRWLRYFLLIIVLCLLSLSVLGCGISQREPEARTPTLASTSQSLVEVNITPQLLPTPTVGQDSRTVVPTWTHPPPATPTPPQPTVEDSICDHPGQVIEDVYSSSIAGDSLNYRIYLPPCYGQDGRVYPTLYLLHGSAQTDSHWDNLGLDEKADELIQSGTIPAIIIVMPDGGIISQETSGGPSSFEGVILSELMPHVESKYCAGHDSNFRALGGVSRGGYWALEIAFRNPDELSSVGGHSAAFLDVAAGSNIDPLVTVKDADLDNLRIYLDIGAEDYVLSNLQPLHELLLEIGKDHQWLLNNGRHEDQYWSSHLEDYLLWYTDPWAIERMLYPSCSVAPLER